MQSWYFDAGWGLINLSRQKRLWRFFSSCSPQWPPGGRRAQGTGSSLETARLHLPETKGEGRTDQLQKKTQLPQQPRKLMLNLQQSMQKCFTITWWGLYTCRWFDISYARPSFVCYGPNTQSEWSQSEMIKHITEAFVITQSHPDRDFCCVPACIWIIALKGHYVDLENKFKLVIILRFKIIQ